MKAIVSVLAALCLAGCIETDDALFPTDNGESVVMESGLYECTHTRDQAVRQVTITEVRTNMGAVYVHADESRTALITLHSAGVDTYFAVTPRQGQNGQEIGIIRIKDESSFERVFYPKDVLEAEAKERGIAVEESWKDTYRITGGTRERRELLQVMADKSGDFPINYSCARKE